MLKTSVFIYEDLATLMHGRGKCSLEGLTRKWEPSEILRIRLREVNGDAEIG